MLTWVVEDSILYCEGLARQMLKLFCPSLYLDFNSSDKFQAWLNRRISSTSDNTSIISDLGVRRGRNRTRQNKRHQLTEPTHWTRNHFRRTRMCPIHEGLTEVSRMLNKRIENRPMRDLWTHIQKFVSLRQDIQAKTSFSYLCSEGFYRLVCS